MTDIRPLHGAALDAADAQVHRVTREDLARPTPCSAWNLSDLLAHMVGQHLGFATAVREGSAPRAAYAPRPYTLERWARSVSTLRGAFAQADLDAEAVLIEISPDPRPVRWAVGAQLLDTAVHTWDVACALGTSYVPSPELVEAVARGAAAVPDDGRSRPGAAFGPMRPARGSDWERALAQLGRDPRFGRP